jgi:hypothetical protein
VLSTPTSTTQPLDRVDDYYKALQDLDNQIQQIKRISNPTISDSKNLHLLKFVQAFEFFFTDKREQSMIIFEQLFGMTKQFISNMSDIIEDDDYFDMTPEIEFFSKPVRSTSNDYSQSESNQDYLVIDMNDRSLKQLQVWARRLLDPKKGIEIKNRKWRLRTYESCFLCSEAVTFTSKNGSLSRNDAVEFLQRMMNRYLLRHVHDDHLIEDEYLFFTVQPELIDIVFDPIFVEGYLLRKSGVKWVKRYAVLYVKALVLFETGPGTRVTEVIGLDGGQVVVGLPNAVVDGKEEDSALFSLIIGLPVGGDVNAVMFSADKQDRAAWISGFQQIPQVRVQLF